MPGTTSGRERTAGSPPETVGRQKDVWVGALSAVSCGIIGSAVIVLYPDNAMLGVLGVVVLPFALAFYKTRRTSDAAAITWLNEIFVGGGGAWIKLGPFSGRWLLLVTVLLIWIMSPRPGPASCKKGSTVSVLFFGLALPSWLVFYAVQIKNIDVASALADAGFLVALLVYFPLRRVVTAQWETVAGWLLGASVVMWGLSMAMCVGPLGLRGAVVAAILGELSVGQFSSGVDRISTVHIVILFLPIFMALLSATRRRVSWSRRVFLWSTAFLVMLPMLLNFLRGPILAIAGVAMLLAAWRAWYFQRPLQLVTSLALSAVAALATVAVLLQVSPEWCQRALDAWDNGDRSWWVDDTRALQAESMWDALAEEPVLGKGLGAPLLNVNNEVATAFELQYNMLLYRFGTVAFVVFAGGLFSLLVEPFRRPFRRMATSLEGTGLFGISLWASIVCILVAGSMNPYLRTPFTGMFIALYLSMRERRAGARSSTGKYPAAREWNRSVCELGAQEARCGTA